MPLTPTLSPRAGRGRDPRSGRVRGGQATRSDYAIANLRALDRYVLEGSRIGEIGNQPETGFADPRSHAVDETQLPDRRVNHPVGEDLLHLVEDRGALLVVEL